MSSQMSHLLSWHVSLAVHILIFSIQWRLHVNVCYNHACPQIPPLPHPTTKLDALRAVSEVISLGLNLNELAK